MTPSDVARARALLLNAREVLILTGAGVSADSGVPTFRGPDGLWRHHRPETLATPEAFARDPRLVWEWYDWRRSRVSACRPNAAHLAVADFVYNLPSSRIVTQNVDELHGDAARAAAEGRGMAPALPLELHGSLFRVKCTRCAHRAPHRDPIVTSAVETLPTCPRCGALLRPDVVWFGESLDPAVLGEAVARAERADVCLVVGTSGVVQPAAGLAGLTRGAGGTVVEVNPEPTPLTAIADVSLRGTAVEVVPRIVA
jgi:NAD-dependent deacetylase